MNDQEILEQMVALLEANGVTIRTEPLGGSGGGLCAMKDKKIFFIDTQASSAEMAPICAEAVAKTIDIENTYISIASCTKISLVIP